MHNKLPKEELWSRFDMCELKLCEHVFKEEGPTEPVTDVCEIFQWGGRLEMFQINKDYKK